MHFQVRTLLVILSTAAASNVPLTILKLQLNPPLFSPLS